MKPPSFYHPVVQFALPFAVGLLFYRAGYLALIEVRNLPLQVVQIQARQAPLPPLVLPTIYIASTPQSKSQARATPRASFPNHSPDMDPLTIAPLKIVVQPRTLKSFLSGLKVTGMTTEGVLIDGIHYPFGKAIYFEDLASGNAIAATPLFIEKVGRKARFSFGKEIIDVSTGK